MTEFREDVKYEDMLHELMHRADLAIRFDCADPRANFIQLGWFMFPAGTLSKHAEVERAT